MESKILILLGLLEAASVAHASCAYGTSLHPRAEGAVEINDFGYTGAIVSPLSSSSPSIPHGQPLIYTMLH